MKQHIVYTIECGDGTYYTGYTDDLERRLSAHRAARAAKYTRGRGPFHLVRACTYASKSEAMRAEYQFKRLTREKKKEWIEKDGIYAVQGGSKNVDPEKLSE